MSDRDAPIVENRLTILSDLAANMFAALLLILILLLQAKIAHPLGTRDPPPPASLNATADLGALPHQPLSGLALVDLLRQRVEGTTGLDLDLTDAGLVASGSLGTGWPRRPLDGSAIGSELSAGLASLPADEPVRLYVFSNRWYPTVTAALRRSGHAFVEMSVPDALRSAGGDTWSPAFLALAAPAESPEAFRETLAHLLAGSTRKLSRSGHSVTPQAAGGGTGGTPTGAVFDVHAILHGVVIALTLGILALGVGFVVAVGRIVVEPVLRYPGDPG